MNTVRGHDLPSWRSTCGSIPDTLIESELFGYAPGSFTGANAKGKRGLIELANHGTVFLDDVDALSPNFQAKLLRVHAGAGDHSRGRRFRDPCGCAVHRSYEP